MTVEKDLETVLVFSPFLVHRKNSKTRTGRLLFFFYRYCICLKTSYLNRRVKHCPLSCLSLPILSLNGTKKTLGRGGRSRESSNRDSKLIQRRRRFKVGDCSGIRESWMDIIVTTDTFLWDILSSTQRRGVSLVPNCVFNSSQGLFNPFIHRRSNPCF